MCPGCMADVDGKVPPSQPLRTPTQFPALVTNVDHAPSYSVDAVEAIHLGAMGHHLVAYAQLRHGGKAGRLHQDASADGLRIFELFKNRDVMASTRQQGCRCQPSKTRADDGDPKVGFQIRRSAIGMSTI